MEKVEGFADLAQCQGAKAMIATLWEVADERTPVLMKEFYRLRMSDPSITKDEAPRQAHMALLTAKIRGDASIDRGPRTTREGEAPRFVKDAQRPYPSVLLGAISFDG